VAASALDAEIVWRIVPLDAPSVSRHCARCNRIRAFVSTHRFRLNAQGRRVDVWLLYECSECQTTWKREVFARRTPEEIGGDFALFERNDAGIALREALRGAGAAERFRVERDALSPQVPLRLRLEVPHPCALRLDVLLARELALSRSLLRYRCERGEIAIEPGGLRDLSRDVRDGTVVVFHFSLSAS